MFEYNPNLFTGEPKPWRSAYEIAMEARKQEERRIRSLYDNLGWTAPQAARAAERKERFLSILKAPLRIISTLMG